MTRGRTFYETILIVFKIKIYWPLVDGYTGISYENKRASHSVNLIF